MSDLAGAKRGGTAAGAVNDQAAISERFQAAVHRVKTLRQSNAAKVGATSRSTSGRIQIRVLPLTPTEG